MILEHYSIQNLKEKTLLASQRANLRNRPKLRIHPGFIQFTLMVEVFIDIEHKNKTKINLVSKPPKLKIYNGLDLPLIRFGTNQTHGSDVHNNWS